MKHTVGLPKNHVRGVYSMAQKTPTGTFALSKPAIFKQTTLLFNIHSLNSENCRLD